MNNIEELIANNTTKVLEAIEEIVWMKDVTYIEAVTIWCDKYNIEIEIIAPIIKKNSKFKNAIAEEAEKLNYLPKTNRLPEL